MKKIALGLCLIYAGVANYVWCEYQPEPTAKWECPAVVYLYNNGYTELEIMGHFYHVIIKEHVHDCPGCDYEWHKAMLID